jgi:hypothetical protein
MIGLQAMLFDFVCTPAGLVQISPCPFAASIERILRILVFRGKVGIAMDGECLGFRWI